MTELTPTTDIPISRTTWLDRPIAAALSLDLEKATYLLFIVISLITRIWGVGDRVVSHDESLHTQYSYQYYNGDGYQHSALMHGPSLFHLTALSYWLFGPSDASSRLPVALLGTLLVVLPYFLRGWIGRIGAIAASFLLLISPYITYYSRYIRHDVYIITFAAILFIAILHHLRQPREKYLWWFAAALALMFTTMETSFIYVAIFGSFLVLRLAASVITAEWFRDNFGLYRAPLAAMALALGLFGLAYAGHTFGGEALAGLTPTPAATEEGGFAAQPDETTEGFAGAEGESGLLRGLRWLQIAGLAGFAGALLWLAHRMRPHLDGYPEFDLIVLLATLILPSVSAFLVIIAGADPLNYAFACPVPAGQDLSAVGEFLLRFTDPACRVDFLSSDLLMTSVFVIATLVVSVLVGMWWNRRRWLIAAAIYHGIFLLLYTSFFSNPAGWASGTVGSLAYWLAQHDVRRADQPVYFYALVLPLYEFLPLLLTFLGAALWSRKHRLGKVLGYWSGLFLVALLVFRLSNWWVNRNVAAPDERSTMAGLLLAGILLLVGALYWFRSRRPFDDLLYWVGLALMAAVAFALANWWLSGRSDALDSTFAFVLAGLILLLGAFYRFFRSGKLSQGELFGFVPFALWWFLMSWIIYSFAGEKMAWLSSHFVLPMVLIGGWYVNERVHSANLAELQTWRFVRQVVLAALILFVVGLALAPLLNGTVRLGAQEADNLRGLGRVLGLLLLAGGLYYLLRHFGRDFEPRTVRRAVLFAFLGLLALFTIRANYMASFKNADYVNEFLVYAHGAPATKSEVLRQLEDLSMRLYGDKSIRVGFDNDSSWPYLWYLRDYPNRVYFGENPDRSIADYPVVIVGSQNWGKVEPLLGNDYESRTYTFLWWPMEEYRKLSWNAILGDPAVDGAARRGIFNPDVRRALWDILVYRDYEAYASVYGGSYTAGQWPLRHDLRLYISRDHLADMWDYGLNAAAIEPPVDPYAENEFQLAPVLSIGAPGAAPGEFLQPRDLAVADDKTLFVADSGNNRIQVFTAAGEFLHEWGSPGSEPGQFSEPWGIAVDDDFVYVADTWNHRIQKFTHAGELVDVFGASGSPAPGETGDGLFYGPRDIIVLPDGNLLISDTGNKRLQLFDRDGNFLQSIGSEGSEMGQFSEPVGLGVDPDGTVYVADTWNGRIQQFTADFFPFYDWPIDAWFGQSIENKPYLAVDVQGRVYASDPEGARILIFDATGRYLGRFGRPGAALEELGLPNGLALSADGHLFVVDAGNNRVLKFEAPLENQPAPLELEEPAAEEQSNQEEEPADSGAAASPTAEG